MISKHVHNNRESKEVQILRYAREVCKLSLKVVADKIQLKAMDIDHYENGRRFYTPEELDMFLKMYEFDKEDFKSLLEMKMINKIKNKV
ncbi:MAG: helix-turn-helix transcriptional regulator [Bacteriovorax sp.]|nr:helix-turn-helix transcriptional regulator [Bacteriovorax sp.]